LVREFCPGRKSPWKIWLGILSGLLFPRKARPGATQFTAESIGDGVSRASRFSYWGVLIGLGQGMTYIPEEAKVIYQSKDGKEEKVFDALEWLAAMPACACRTQTGALMCPIRESKWSDTEFIRLRSYYSNVSRGKRQKENQDGHIPYILEQEGSKKEYRKNWARLIQKIYACPPVFMAEG